MNKHSSVNACCMKRVCNGCDLAAIQRVGRGGGEGRGREEEDEQSVDQDGEPPCQ